MGNFGTTTNDLEIYGDETLGSPSNSLGRTYNRDGSVCGLSGNDVEDLSSAGKDLVQNPEKTPPQHRETIALFQRWETQPTTGGRGGGPSRGGVFSSKVRESNATNRLVARVSQV